MAPRHMSDDITFPVSGSCTCGAVRYRMLMPPLFVHCCHCSWCQRETGASYALNALIESEQVELVQGDIETIHTPSNSGQGQDIVRCTVCKSALWSHYGAAGKTVSFIRVGTLDKPGDFPPDIHIFTSTKQNWINLAGDVPVVEEYYQRSKHWPQKSIDRYTSAIKGPTDE